MSLFLVVVPFIYICYWEFFSAKMNCRFIQFFNVVNLTGKILPGNICLALEEHITLDMKFGMNCVGNESLNLNKANRVNYNISVQNVD
jgi:hypothetical protein